MNPELETYKTLWADRENRAAAKDYATQYCVDHRELRARYGALTLQEIVKLIDFYREEGDEESVVEAEIWLVVNHPPQVIGTTISMGG